MNIASAFSGSHSTSPVIAEFLRTRSPGSVDTYFDALRTLRPDRLTLSEIIKIVSWVEHQKIPHPVPTEHSNVFGTGGDGTVNISSMAAILASHRTEIVKVGTPAVTSRFGSYDFFNALVHLPACAHGIRRLMHFAEGSCYIPLADFGFPYNPLLRLARRRLKAEGIPDIYKVVFPFANYTNPRIQLNGVATSAYFDIFDRLATNLNRSVCIVHSSHGIDEAMPGNNIVLFISGSRRVQLEWQFSVDSANRVWTTFAEKNTARETVELFEQIVLGRGPAIIEETIIANAALLLASRRMVDSSSSEFREFLDIATRDIASLITRN